jgi:hypothetical protein
MLFLFQKQTLVRNDFAYSSFFRGKVNNIFFAFLQQQQFVLFINGYVIGSEG